MAENETVAQSFKCHVEHVFLHIDRYTAEGLDPEPARCWKSSMDQQDCTGVTVLHLMGGCGHPFPSLGKMYLPYLHIHKCQRWFCIASARWDGRISAGSPADFHSLGINAGRLHL